MLNILKRNTISSQAAKRYLHTTQWQNGYIVLVPEIGENAHAGEGILKPDSLPAFSDITIENCLGAIGHQASAVEKQVKEMESDITEKPNNVNIAEIFHKLDGVSDPLNTTWGIAKALYLGNCTLIPTKSYMSIHERARNARAAKFNSIVLHDELQHANNENLSGDANRLRQKFLLEGRLNGMTLPATKRNELKNILIQLGKERAIYKNKTNMSVHTFSHHINDTQLMRDFPSTVLQATAIDSAHATQGPWKITLQPQIVKSFLKYCPDRVQRWNVWLANVRKCSGQLEKSLENSTHLEKIRELRQRQANILGFQNFASMSMETKMVGSVKNLKQIFKKLLQFAGPAQYVEIADLQTFATDCGFEHKLEIYDIDYWQRKYLLSKYDIDEELLRAYFPLPRVFDGLFQFTEKLFGVKIVERKDAEVWQPAVKYYDVFEGDSSTPLGGFYIDFYSKENKLGKNNGWMVSIRNRNVTANTTPLCALIFNFTSPTDNKPYLMSIEDVRMVFKSFGSALQHLLTKANYSELAGLSNIEWDASQVIGNVMSNFLDFSSVLQSVSGHYLNGETLPKQIAGNSQLLKTHLAGYNLCNELYLADLDIELHQQKDFWLDIVKKLWAVYNCMTLDKKDAHPCSMTDIISGDWAAAQFSHLYSKIIAADLSAAFEDTDEIGNVGKRFKDSFLANDGSLPTSELFRRFRGRDPSVESFLRSNNILHSFQPSDEL